jgi:hypothetical protein
MSAEAEAEAEGSSVHALELPLIGGVVSRDGLAFERAGERCAKSNDLN